MPTIDMQDTNRRTIVALDAGDIFHAERLFARNYRAHPRLMTALNYANFLGDCHHLSGQGIAAELVGGGGSAAGTDVCREFRAGSAGFLDDALIACRQDSNVFDPSIHHLTRNACHFIGCPIHGESAE